MPWARRPTEQSAPGASLDDASTPPSEEDRLPPTLLTLPQLANVIDVEYRTLHNWVVRGLLPPSLQASAGSGVPNLFDTDDAILAKVLGDMRHAGLSLDTVERAAPVLQRHREKLTKGAFMLLNGTIEVTTDEKRAQEAVNNDAWTLVYNSEHAIAAVRERLADSARRVAA